MDVENFFFFFFLSGDFRVHFSSNETETTIDSGVIKKKKVAFILGVLAFKVKFKHVLLRSAD